MRRDQSIHRYVVEFVRLAEKAGCRNFTIDLRNRATFNATMAVARGGNNFDPDLVAGTIGTLFDDAMRVEFGAEASSVLYIEVPTFEHQRIGSTSLDMTHRFTDAERQAYAQRVIDWAKRMRADRITVQQHPATPAPVVGEPGEHPFRIRLWWD
jgi:hypothetical protein